MLLISYRQHWQPAGRDPSGVPRFVPGEREEVTYTPKADKAERARLTHAALSVRWSESDGVVTCAGTTAPLRYGRREFVGAIKKHGRVYARVHCHGCGKESQLVLKTWRDNKAELCKPCTDRKVTAGAFNPQVKP